MPGYWKTESVTAEAVKHTQLLVPPDGHLTRRTHSLSRHAPRTEAAQSMRQALTDAHTRQLYQRRQGIVEPVFGSIKEHRGFRRTLFRGLRNVQGEWQLICLTHNLLRLFGQRQKCNLPERNSRLTCFHHPYPSPYRVPASGSASPKSQRNRTLSGAASAISDTLLTLSPSEPYLSC